MPVSTSKPLAAAILVALPLAATAQAQFSINNPLVKPQPRSLATAPTDAKEAPRVPVARAVPDGGGSPPWPAAGSGLPSQSAESAAREELAAYTVVAIVGDAAVLRTNVGLVASHSTPSGGSAHGQPAPVAATGGNAPQQAPRQHAMRVRTGQALTVGGATVVPTVGVSTVEFRSGNGRALLFTASLDSQSPQAFVPTTREASDPAVAARATPTPPSISGISPSVANGAIGSSGSGATSASR